MISGDAGKGIVPVVKVSTLEVWLATSIVRDQVAQVLLHVVQRSVERWRPVGQWPYVATQSREAAIMSCDLVWGRSHWSEGLRGLASGACAGSATVRESSR